LIPHGSASRLSNRSHMSHQPFRAPPPPAAPAACRIHSTVRPALRGSTLLDRLIAFSERYMPVVSDTQAA